MLQDYLFNANQRLYWLYLLATVLWATVWYAKAWRQRNPFAKTGSIWQDYWWHKSARLDYLYFVGFWVFQATLLPPSVYFTAYLSEQLTQFLHRFAPPVQNDWAMIWIVIAYTTALFTFGEFSRYWLHRKFHASAWLWAFHKAHHSAEVLTPITYYRVHPVEKMLFAVRYLFSVGMVTGFSQWLFAGRLDMGTILGANGLVFIFSVIGGNLRHSHIYLRYPSWLENWFLSPAQHQMHHTNRFASYNYGGYLGIWDKLFGTFASSEQLPQMPQKYGFHAKIGQHYQTMSGFLWQPFVDCWAILRKKLVKNSIKQPIDNLDKSHH